MGTSTLANEVCDQVPFFFKALQFVSLGFFLGFRNVALFSLIASSISAVTDGFFGLNFFMNFDGRWL